MAVVKVTTVGSRPDWSTETMIPSQARVSPIFARCLRVLERAESANFVDENALFANLGCQASEPLPADRSMASALTDFVVSLSLFPHSRNEGNGRGGM